MKWEYTIIQLSSYTYDSIEKNMATLNDMGLNGWELVSVHSRRDEAFFKREITERSMAE